MPQHWQNIFPQADSWLSAPVLQVVNNACSDKDGDTELFQDTENT